jgi:hypothetical protein
VDVRDTSILMVQNTHYGSRDDLPFDLRHKAGPIQFTLAPGAAKQQIASEQAKLRGALVARLRPYLKIKPVAQRPLHKEIPSTYNKAAFAEPNELLARLGAGTPDEAAYLFNETRAFYLRLIPHYARTSLLSHASLAEIAVHKREIDLLVRQRYVGCADRNRFGAITFEPHGTATIPLAITQVFPNGELWALTTEWFAHWQGYDLIPTTNVYNIFLRVVENFVSWTEQEMRSIDEWIAHQNVKIERPEAIRRLVEIGLKAKK